MKIYNDIKAIAKGGQLTIEVGPHMAGEMPVYEAMRQCDKEYYAAQIKYLDDALKAGKDCQVQLATDKSRLRGYSGGLLKIIGDGENIIFSQRNASDYRNPSKLDISGAVSGYPVEESDWLELMIARCAGQIAHITHGGHIIIPELEVSYSGYQEKTQENVMKSVQQAKIPRVDYIPFEMKLVAPKNAANVRIHSGDKPYVLEFRAGVAFEPETSGIDFMMYAAHTGKNLPENISHKDTSCNADGSRQDKNIFEIDVESGAVRIWQRGVMIGQSNITSAGDKMMINGYEMTGRLERLIRSDAWPFSADIGKLKIRRVLK